MAVKVKDSARTPSTPSRGISKDMPDTQRVFDDEYMVWLEDQVDPSITTMSRLYQPATITGNIPEEDDTGHIISDDPVPPVLSVIVVADDGVNPEPYEYAVGEALNNNPQFGDITSTTNYETLEDGATILTAEMTVNGTAQAGSYTAKDSDVIHVKVVDTAGNEREWVIDAIVMYPQATATNALGPYMWTVDDEPVDEDTTVDFIDNGNTLTYVITSLPTGVVDDGDGTISGIVEVERNSSFTSTATDQHGRRTTSTAPYTSVYRTQASAGAPLDLNFAVDIEITPTDLAVNWNENGNTLTYVISGTPLPPALSMDTDALMTGTPTASTAEIPYTLQGTDEYGRVTTDTFAMAIAGVAPTITTLPTINNMSPDTNDILTAIYGDTEGVPTPDNSGEWFADAVSLGVTSLTLNLTAAELGKVITFVQTASNTTPPDATATSLGTAPVEAAPTAPSIDDVATITAPDGNEVFKTLVATEATFSGIPTPDVESYFTRNNVPFGVEGALTYDTVESDIGLPIGYRSTGTNDVNSAVSDAAPTITIVGIAPYIDGALPVISPTDTVQGTMYTVTDGDWGGTPTPTLKSYQWKSGTNNVGANTNTYTTVLGDIGENITCVVTYTNSVDDTPATSLPVGPVTAIPVSVNTTPPKIIPELTAIGTLYSHDDGAWTNNPTSYTQTWYVDGDPVSTAATYTTDNNDATLVLTVEVTAINAGGPSEPEAASNPITVDGIVVTAAGNLTDWNITESDLPATKPTSGDFSGTEPITYAIVTAPAGISIDTATGVLTAAVGTAVQAGTSIVVSGTNTWTTTPVESGFSLTVEAAYVPPSINTDAEISGNPEAGSLLIGTPATFDGNPAPTVVSHFTRNGDTFGDPDITEYTTIDPDDIGDVIGYRSVGTNEPSVLAASRLPGSRRGRRRSSVIQLASVTSDAANPITVTDGGAITSDFVMTVETGGPGTFTMPHAGGSFNYVISSPTAVPPGNTPQAVTAFDDPNCTLTFAGEGPHEIRCSIEGISGGIMSNIYCNNKDEALKIRTVENFGVMGWVGFTNGFRGASEMTSFIAGNTDTSAVLKADRFFNSCTKLATCDVSTFDLSSCNNLSSFFNACTALTSIDVSSFNPVLVTTAGYMFSNCTSLTSLTLGTFHMPECINTAEMFRKLTNLTSLDMSGMTTPKVTTTTAMFRDCTGISTFDVSSFDMSNNADMSRMFQNTTATDYIGVEDFDIGSLNGTGDLNVFINGGGLIPTARYDDLLINWEGQLASSSVPTNMLAGFGDSVNSAASATEKAKLSELVVNGGYEWTITDGT